ncbi:MAG TPA: CHAT domain-containing protein [Terriglobia bacterium]|nr:CHAT domain-containing protein [Terriglobia bacterium]
MGPQEALQQTFDGIWGEIRGAKLYAGQPRNEASAHSVSLARHALQLATDSGSDRFLVEAWRMLAYSLTANEQYEEAIPYYKSAIEKLEHMTDHRQAARNRIGYVAALAYAGRRQEAIDVAGIAEKWFLQNQDEEGRARLFTNLGNLYHSLDEYMQGVEYHTAAAGIFEKLGDKRALAQTYTNLASGLSMVGQFEHADELFERAGKLSDELELFDLSAQASYNRGYLHYLRGRYSDALRSFAGLRQRFDRGDSTRHRAHCDLDEAEIYLELRLSKDASTLAERAAERFKEIGMPNEQGKATGFYGVAMMQMGRFPEALDAFQAAQEIFEDQHNLYWIGLLHLYRGEVHLSLQRLVEAKALALQAKLSFEQLSIPSKRIFSLVLLGRAAMALNDLAAAEASTQEISALIPTTRMPLVLFPYHVLSAEIAERVQSWEEARRHYELAAQELERHWARLHHDDLRVTFFKGRHQTYDALVRLSLDQMDPSEGLAAAYAWCERARSRGLVELLSHSTPAIHGQADQSMLAKINRLREELNIQYVRSQSEARPLTAQTNYENIALKEQELARSLREVSQVDPEYASLQDVSFATVESVRAALPERTTLVEYFTTGDEVLAFILSRNDAKVVRRLYSASGILKLQRRLGFQFDKFQLGRDYVATHSEQLFESVRHRLQELYEYLITPFIREIQTPHIVIVPHGAMHFLPFHALYDGEKYLIDRFEISYAPSASVLKYCLEKKDVPGNSPLLVGVPDHKAPLIGEELSRLNRLFPNARVLRDEQAGRAAFMESSKASSFLHIATHAIFRRDNPMFSSFKLADGWFTALDLFSMVCQTNLVTLSGCQSGLSEVTGSDDLLGFMRGFLYAGARSLLLSLWNVNDESTAQLMVHFYREWQKGVAKSIAFRSAMLAVRKEHPHPFYWAPFLLVGNP